MKKTKEQLLYELEVERKLKKDRDNRKSLEDEIKSLRADRFKSGKLYKSTVGVGKSFGSIGKGMGNTMKAIDRDMQKLNTVKQKPKKKSKRTKVNDPFYIDNNEWF